MSDSTSTSRFEALSGGKDRARFSSLVKRGLLVFFLIFVLAALVLKHRADSILHRCAENRLAAIFPELEIDFDSIRLIETQGISMRGVRVYDKPSRGAVRKQPRLCVDEAFFRVSASRAALLSGNVALDRIVLRHPTFHISRRAGRSDLSRFIPNLDGGLGGCPIEITGATIAAHDDGMEDDGAPYTLSGLTCAILPPGVSASRLSETSGRFDFDRNLSRSGWQGDDAAPRRLDSLGQQAAQAQSLWRVESEGTNNRLRKLAIHMTASPDGKRWRLRGEIDTFETGPEFIRALIQDPSRYGPLETLRGYNTLTFSMADDAARPEGFRYALAGSMCRGSVSLAVLDQPIADLFIEYRAENDRVEVSRMTGRSGSVLLLGDYRQEPGGQAAVRLQLEEFPLTGETIEKARQRGLGAILCVPDTGLLSAIRFQTTAKLYAEFQRRGAQWRSKEIRLSCRDLSIEGEMLPERMDRLTGELTLDENETLTFRVGGGDGRLALDGAFTSALHAPAGEMKIHSSGIAVNDRLIGLLPEHCRGEIEALHPSGTVDAEVLLRRFCDDGGNPQNQFSLAIDVRDGAFCYDRFLFPVSGVRGRIDYADDVWRFTDFHVSGSGAEAGIEGDIHDTPDGDALLTLSIDIKRFPLGEELSAALIEPDKRQLVDNLHLSGRADAHVQAEYSTRAGKFSLRFDTVPFEKSVSICPAVFPYKIEELEGTLSYRDGEITARDIRGRSGPAAFYANAVSRFGADGSWQFGLFPVTVDQLPIDHRLEDAATEDVRRMLGALRLAGYLNLGGNVLFRQNAPGAPVETLWEGDVIFERNSASLARPVEGLCGKMRMWGKSSNGRIESVLGELGIENLFVNNVQVTSVTGPFSFDGRELRFGNTAWGPEKTPLQQEEFFRGRLPVSGISPSGARSGGDVRVIDSETILRAQGGTGQDESLLQIASPNPEASLQSLHLAENSLSMGRPVIGELFRGTANISGGILLGDPVVYRVGILLRDGNLRDVGRDLNGGQSQVRGRLTFYADLQGEGKNLNALKGNGGVVVTEADLYEVPQILRIFQSLSVNEPDQTAFNACYVDFQVYGNQLALKRVTLEGESLTLFGDGSLTLVGNQQLLDLTMNSRLGNKKNRIPVVSDLIGGAGDQIAQVRIEGPLHDPSVWQERFPGIKKAWWSIFPESAPADQGGHPPKRRLLNL
ncbi:MAG: AsmA-like C-terminal domain-containing protein [Thermoguttaceae bacterium]|nr:AsmA-like C-terminal domain-containing protein [Thermoguttaceae bacterium]